MVVRLMSLLLVCCCCCCCCWFVVVVVIVVGLLVCCCCCFMLRDLGLLSLRAYGGLFSWSGDSSPFCLALLPRSALVNNNTV